MGAMKNLYKVFIKVKEDLQKIQLLIMVRVECFTKKNMLTTSWNVLK